MRKRLKRGQGAVATTTAELKLRVPRRRDGRLDRLAARYRPGSRPSYCDPLAVLAFVVCLTLILEWLNLSFWPSRQPDDPQGLLVPLWQVHTAVVVLGFPLLVLSIQLSREQGVLAALSAEVLATSTYTAPTMVFALGGVLVIGGAAAWWPSAEAFLIALLLVHLPSLVFLGHAYWRAAALLFDPSEMRHRSTKLAKYTISSTTENDSPKRRMGDVLYTLRGQILLAIERKDWAETTEGFRIYRELVVCIWGEYKRYEGCSSRQLDHEVVNNHDARMDWLSDDLQLFVGRTFESGRPDLAREALKLVHEVASAACVDRNSYRLERVLSTTVFTFDRGRLRFSRPEWVELRTQLLNQLIELGGSLATRAPEHDDVDSFAEICLATFVDLACSAIDAETIDNLEAVLDGIHRIGPLPKTGPPCRERLSNDDEKDPQRIHDLKQVSFLGILVYVLLRRDRQRGSSEHLASCVKVILQNIGSLRWGAMLKARDVLRGPRFDWFKWEARIGGPPFEFGSLDALLMRAIVHVGLHGRLPSRLPSIHATRRDDLRKLLAEMASVTQEMLDPEWIDWLSKLEMDGRVESRIGLLSDDIVGLRRNESDDLIEAALDEEMLENLFSGLAEGWDELAEFRLLFGSTTSTTGLRWPEAERPDPIGLEEDVDKYWLTTGSSSELARRVGLQYGNGLARVEMKTGLEELMAGSEPKEALADGFRDEVSRAISVLRSDGHDPHVLLLNGIEMSRLLLGRTVVRTAGEEFEGAPITMVHGEGESYCLVADFRRLATLTYYVQEPEEGCNRLLSGDRLLAGVEPIAEESARRIAQDRPEVMLQPDEDSITQEETVRRLRQKVIFRALVARELQVTDPSAAVKIVLTPEG